MNELILNNDEKIENLIYEIRGVQVMLDSDLAKLYQVETKRSMKQLVEISINFQKDFVLELPKKNLIL